MATTIDYDQLGRKVLEALGGEGNVRSLAHCATRLRFALKDPQRADLDAVQRVPGVITALRSGGLHQVVVGNDVALAYAAVTARTGLGGASGGQGDGAGDRDGAREGRRRGGTGSGRVGDAVEPRERSLFNRFIAMISSIFTSVIWTMAAVGLVKAMLALFSTGIPLIDPASQTYALINALGDGLLYLLPVVLAVSAAKYFQVNYGTSMAIAAFLVHPSLVGFLEAGEPVSLAGIPVVLAPYAYSVFPIIAAVWLQSLVEPRLMRALPGWMRNFATPFVVVVVVGFAALLVIGPVISLATSAVADALTWIWGPAPAVGGFLLGGLWQVLVMFGLHHGLTPIFLQELSATGSILLMGPLISAVTAQCAAALAVTFRVRDRRLRQMAGPASVSGFVSGVTEPIIYGVNLPLKRPFTIGVGAGAVGGAIAASGGSAASANVFSSLLTLPAFLDHGNFALQLLGTGTAILLAFTATYLFGVPRDRRGGDEPAEAPPAPIPTLDLLSPVRGRSVALDDVADPVFASGSMGQGLAVRPAEGRVLAPIEGTVVTALASGHAFGIRSADGAEVLIHIGLDTVELDGVPFTAHVAQDQRVRAGQPLADVDLDAVRAAGYDPSVVMVVTNAGAFGTVLPRVGVELEAGDVAVVLER
ncbi:glucose PTS transporter subunit IIA [Rothia sp. AR01]|uniref:Glucose PTS transporter subunit IIA n=1 Tax=Rothia santali TaxID=2949643 RepID=A0A9X2HIU6_9MICC|nr:glucose PTS transporter subunit IIA [Rothia santali]MCP3425643.1 glucose PTS transporter subunit IIA [Rothia santali]